VIDDPLGYTGRQVVVTGAASGMGAATAAILAGLGATVVALDVKAIDGPAETKLQVDLRDPASIDRVVKAIDGPVQAVFSVAGLPGAPFSDLDTVLVNFVGARHLVEALVPQMPDSGAVVCVGSTAGMGWQQEIYDLLPFVQTDGFESGRAWCEAHPERLQVPYMFSKKALNAWVAWRAASLLRQNGIRLNCSNPGPTDTAMMPAFEAQVGAAMIDAYVGPGGRRSTAEEQAWPLVFVNSPRASFIAGESFQVDNGFMAALLTNQLA
jgi:NAD(P)-dependent dehydrogenase (short-subunit alcohol dehydrogenase family)